MTAISLRLPDDLARQSKEVAEKIGISRTELIRVALEHELANIRKQMERNDMAKALQAMRDDPDYRREVSDLDEGLDNELPEDMDCWWQG
jgi:metal-responsive CopG/Arc/MetJ family transcriptional regulator